MLTVDSDDPTPVYAQLERAIRADITIGKLAAGTRLPTVRELAIQLGINPNTVAKVYSQLVRAGVLATQRGVGTFVRENTDAHVTKVSPRDRERVLHHLIDNFLAELRAHGLTMSDAVRHLDGLRPKTPAE